MDKQLPTRLSDAIARGNFESANPLIEQYGKAVKENLKQAQTPEDRQAIVDEALAFLRDRIHLARTVRAHLATQLKMTARAASYQGHIAHHNTWHLDG